MRHPSHIRHLLTAAALLPVLAFGQVSPLERGKAAIKARTGCYLLDYSFVETEALKPGYGKGAFASASVTSLFDR